MELLQIYYSHARPGASVIHGPRLKAVKPNEDNLQSKELTKFPHMQKKRTLGAKRVFGRNDIQASQAVLH
jgi:hypothetical protein